MLISRSEGNKVCVVCKAVRFCRAESLGIPITAAHAGSLWGFFFHRGPVKDYAAAKQTDVGLFSRFHAAYSSWFSTRGP